MYVNVIIVYCHSIPEEVLLKRNSPRLTEFHHQFGYDANLMMSVLLLYGFQPTEHNEVLSLDAS